MLKHVREVSAGTRDRSSLSRTFVDSSDIPERFDGERTPPTPYLSRIDPASMVGTLHATPPELEPMGARDPGAFLHLDFSDRPLVDTPLVPVSVDLSPHGRIAEWDADSASLVADAYNIRRLLRQGIIRWRVYMRTQDRILDALYIAEKEAEMKLQLAVMLSWLVACEARRGHRRSSDVTQWRCSVRSQRCHFLSWIRQRRIQASLRAAAEVRLTNCKDKFLLVWAIVVQRYSRPSHALSKRHTHGVIHRAWTEWKRRRTGRYLDSIQNSNQLERSQLSRFFTKLKSLRHSSVRARKVGLWALGRVKEGVIREWRKMSVSNEKNRIALQKNHAALYLLYKLSFLTRPAIHVPTQRRMIEPIQQSVLHQALRNWRSFTSDAKKNRLESDQALRAAVLTQWRQRARKSAKLSLASNGILAWAATAGVRQKMGSNFNLWRQRFLRRSILRTQISRWSEKSAVGLVVKTLCGWQEVAVREHRWKRTGKRVSHSCAGKWFRLWRSKFRGQQEEKVREELADVFVRKQSGSLLLGCWQVAIERRRWIVALERKGDFLAMKILFSRWARLLDRRRCVREQQRMETHHMQCVVLTVLRVNVERARKSRMDSVIGTELLKRNGWRRFVGFFKQKKRVNNLHSQALLRAGMKAWVEYMAYSHAVARLESIHAKLEKERAFLTLFQFSLAKADRDNEIFCQLIVARMKDVVHAWRLLPFATRLAHQVAAKRESRIASRAILAETWTTLREEFVQRQRIKRFAGSRDIKLAQLVFDPRRSGWLLTVKARRFAAVTRRSRVAESFLNWVTHVVTARERRERFTSAVVCMHTRNQRLVLLDWFWVVRNRRSNMAAAIAAWRTQVGRKMQTIRNIVVFQNRLIELQKVAVFETWQRRMWRRRLLVGRVSEFAVANEQRLAATTMLAFISVIDERKRVDVLKAANMRHILARSVDRWIHATVLTISLREVFARILTIGDQLRRFRGFERWKNANKIFEFRQRRLLTIDSASTAKQEMMREAVVLAWSAVAHNMRLRNRKILEFKKRNFMKQLRIFSNNRKRNRDLGIVADEFAVSAGTARLVCLVEGIVGGWRSVAANERRLAETGLAVELAREDNERICFFDFWKEAIERKVYDEDLEGNEAVLTQRVQERVVADVFTYLVIVHREAQGLAQFGSDYSASRLRMKVLVAFMCQLSISRRALQVKANAEKRLKMSIFNAIFSEAFFAIKERLVLKHKSARLVFTQLKAYAVVRQRQLQATMIGRWRRQSQQKIDSDKLRIKGKYFASWQAFVMETRLAKQHVMPDSARSYHQQRRKKFDTESPPQTPIATPVTQAVSVHSTPTMFSYRDMRPKSRDEQRI